VNRGAVVVAVAAAALTAAYVVSRAADAVALPEEEGDDADGSTALDYINRWGVIERNTERANVASSTDDTNTRAFLALIAYSEGTDQRADSYRVCFGYRHTIESLTDHPAVTREWLGEKLPDAVCLAAGQQPGCVSTAAGRYQIIRPTWLACKRALGLADFGPESQDAAAVYLIKKRGALDDVKRGRVADAIAKCRAEWASLPGAGYDQPERELAQLTQAYVEAGGNLA
jgi:muramidase (phage lysozyme)